MSQLFILAPFRRIAKSHDLGNPIKVDGIAKSSRCEALKPCGVRRKKNSRLKVYSKQPPSPGPQVLNPALFRHLRAAPTKDEAQRSRWTFCEAVIAFRPRKLTIDIFFPASL
jgi:hypothetical protein